MLVPADSLSLAMKTSPCSASITIARKTGFGSAMLRAGARSKTRGRLSDVLPRSCAATTPGQWRAWIHNAATSKMATIALQNRDETTISFSSLLPIVSSATLDSCLANWKQQRRRNKYQKISQDGFIVSALPDRHHEI